MTPCANSSTAARPRPNKQGTVNKTNPRRTTPVVTYDQSAAIRLQNTIPPRQTPSNHYDLTSARTTTPIKFVTFEDGRLEIPNNRVENAIRPTAVGKKNWLFIGAADVGDRGAIIYTLIEACRRRGIDPFAYLRDVLRRLPAMTNWQVKDVTPAAWQRAHAAEIKAAAQHRAGKRSNAFAKAPRMTLTLFVTVFTVQEAPEMGLAPVPS